MAKTYGGSNAPPDGETHQYEEESPQQEIFTNLAKTFTGWHLRFLELFSDPPTWFQRNDVTLPQSLGGLEQLITTAWPKLQGSYELIKAIFGELYEKGLLNTRAEALHTLMTPHGVTEKRTTKLGDAFLEFIKDDNCPVKVSESVQM